MVNQDPIFGISSRYPEKQMHSAREYQQNGQHFNYRDVTEIRHETTPNGHFQFQNTPSPPNATGQSTYGHENMFNTHPVDPGTLIASGRPIIQSALPIQLRTSREWKSM